MKNLLIFILALSFSSCLELDREKFIGEYAGNASMDAFQNGAKIMNETNIARLTIEPGNNDNEILIDGEIIATVQGSKYTIKEGQFIYSDLTANTAQKYAVTGTAERTSSGNILQKTELITTHNKSEYKLIITGTYEPLD
jgi:hypothetical protein